MKFLVDAQLPRRLAHSLIESGFEVIHTLDLHHQGCGFRKLFSLEPQTLQTVTGVDG
ncbi:MAG: DUF5615 family PIN-like protein [Blastocatellales bacterium]|nr:DUF5615 family PIN-like protein [Blastocatellales bacterium]